jgi:hypothetical protein
MPADVCGPFTLEQLDLFGGNLDTLAFSLDDSIWTLTTTCVLYGDGAVTSAGALASPASVTASGQGFIVAAGNVSALAERIKLISGAIDATGTVVADAVRLRVVDGLISAEGFMSGSATADLSAQSNTWTQQTSGSNTWVQVG